MPPSHHCPVSLRPPPASLSPARLLRPLCVALAASMVGTSPAIACALGRILPREVPGGRERGVRRRGWEGFFDSSTAYQNCPNSRKWAQFLVLYGTNEFRILSQSLYSTCTQIHSKKTCRCHISPLSLSLAPHNSQVYVAAIKRVEGRARLAGPREPDGWHSRQLL